MQKYVFFSKFKFFFQKIHKILLACHKNLCHNKKKRIPNGTLLLCIDFWRPLHFAKFKFCLQN